MDNLISAIQEIAAAIELIQAGYYGKLPEPMVILLTTKSNDLTDALEKLENESLVGEQD